MLSKCVILIHFVIITLPWFSVLYSTLYDNNILKHGLAWPAYHDNKIIIIITMTS